MKILFFFVAIITIISHSESRAQTKCVAHRGGHLEYTENSLGSLLEAHKQGADAVEFDIRHTADGVPILMHDKKLKRVSVDKVGKSCPLKKNINKLKLFDIQDNCRLEGGEEIPTLKEALDLILSTEMEVFIELKDTPTKLTKRIIYESFKDIPKRLRIISFKTKLLEALPEIKGLNKNQTFWSRVQYQNLDLTPWGRKKDYGTSVYIGSYKLRRKHFKKYMGEVGVWTVNKESDMQLLFEDEVDYITTDDLELCMTLKDS